MTTTNSYTPVKVSNLSGAVTVAAGVDHSIVATGAVWNLQARGGPHAASPALGVFCGV